MILPRDKPLKKSGGLVMLRGSLAPDGAVLKTSAADPKLLQHTGRAVVFEDYNDMAARIDRDDLDVDANSVLVLKNAGPLGGPGFPEWGMLPMPKKLIKQGVKDMVRISDGRMSGTSYGTCILHVAPEAYVGGPLAFVQNGDMIELDVEKKALNLKISESEFKTRKAGLEAPAAQVRAQLRRDLLAPREAGERRLRLRLPRGHRADRGPRNPLGGRMTWTLARTFAAAGILAALASAGCAHQERGFDFALIGDMPYTKVQQQEYQRVLAALNAAELGFVVHVGDFQFDARPYNQNPALAAMPCVEENYQAVYESFQSVRHAFILTPGDNDWADCWPLKARQGRSAAAAREPPHDVLSRRAAASGSDRSR